MVVDEAVALRLAVSCTWSPVFTVPPVKLSKGQTPVNRLLHPGSTVLHPDQPPERQLKTISVATSRLPLNPMRTLGAGLLVLTSPKPGLLPVWHVIAGTVTVVWTVAGAGSGTGAS